MSNFYFLAFSKLTKGRGHLLSAVRHNRRAIQAELGSGKNIDATRTYLNETLLGASQPEDVSAYAEQLMKDACIQKLRKDAVRAVEIIFSLPLNHTIDERHFFSECVRWVESHLGGVLLSADIHRDEAVPHCHVLVLPLVNGRLKGSAYVGYKFQLKQKHNSFYENVGVQFGLSKPPDRLTSHDRKKLALSVVASLNSSHDSAINSIVWNEIRAAIEQAPQPFAVKVGMDVVSGSKPMRTMAQIFTSKGRGGARSDGYENLRNLSCVGFAGTHALPGAHRVFSDVPLNQETRVREFEMDPQHFDPIRGEFFEPKNLSERGTTKSESKMR